MSDSNPLNIYCLFLLTSTLLKMKGEKCYYRKLTYEQFTDLKAALQKCTSHIYFDVLMDFFLPS